MACLLPVLSVHPLISVSVVLRLDHRFAEISVAMAAAAATLEQSVGSTFVTSDGKTISYAEAIPDSVKLVMIVYTATW